MNIMNHATGFWTQLGIGVWVMLSPWFLGFSDLTLMKWSNLVAGLAITVLSVWLMCDVSGKRAVSESQSMVQKRSVASR